MILDEAQYYQWRVSSFCDMRTSRVDLDNSNDSIEFKVSVRGLRTGWYKFRYCPLGWCHINSNIVKRTVFWFLILGSIELKESRYHSQVYIDLHYLMLLFKPKRETGWQLKCQNMIQNMIIKNEDGVIHWVKDVFHYTSHGKVTKVTE